MLKVLLPKWWLDDVTVSKEVIGYTDGKTTFLCSAEPCYYVEVPEYEYSGYFSVDDLKVIE